jgi:hypothetical protein
MKVFLGPVEIAGYYAGLHRGLVELGYGVTRVDLEADRRAYPIGRQPVAARLVLLTRRRARETKSGIARKVLGAIESALRWTLFVRVAVACDAFVYAFGTTITWKPALELKLLRLLKRRIVCVYHGSDARPPFLDAQIMATDRRVSIQRCAELTRAQKANVLLMDSFADAVVDNPLSAHFHERSIVNWHAIGVPSVVPLDGATPELPANHQTIRILHSPSHPETKGTELIRRAIDGLRASGSPIEYAEVVGVPHETVLTEIGKSDFVVDQAFSDVPMAGFATEAAALGRPAIVGGFGGDAFRATIRPDQMPPVVYTDPNDLEGAIGRLVADRGLRRILGEEARQFVVTQRSPRVVAERFARLFRGDIPADWFFDPGTIGYLAGVGPPWINQASVRGLVSEFGPSALQLDDKAALREAVIDFAFGASPLRGQEPTLIPARDVTPSNAFQSKEIPNR